MADLEFRPVREEERHLLADLVFGVPEQLGRTVSAAVLGIRDSERLRPLFRALWAAGENWRRTTFAVDGGEVVGLAQLGSSHAPITPRVVLAAARVFGPRVVVLPRRMKILERVAVPKPADALLLSELHVAAARRGTGVGSQLLEFVDRTAAQQGVATIALQTYTTNPARRLYERHGYEVFAEVTDPEFERLTGIAGNVGYLKRLA